MTIIRESENIGNFMSDTAITAKIKAKMAAESDVSALSVHVETNNGTVTLKGEVPNDTALRKAIRIAQATVGVREVIPHLGIESE